MRGQSVVAVLANLNPIIRGWSNYYRTVVSKRLFANIDNWMFDREVQWVRKTHPQKPWYWLKRRYWGRLNPKRNDNWVFGKNPGWLLKLAWTPIVRHVLVKGWSSPDDPDLAEYWVKRNARRNDELSVRQRALAQRQHGLCARCGETVHNDEYLFVHFARSKRLGGEDNADNRQLMHHTCHLQNLAENKRDRDCKRSA